MLDEQLKKEWVAALRSGDYLQGTGRLRNDQYYCCLGVLGCILTEKQPDYYKWNGDYDDYFLDEGSGNHYHEDLPYHILSENVQQPLINMNDGEFGKPETRKTFIEIADYIEENIKALPCKS